MNPIVDEESVDLDAKFLGCLPFNIFHHTLDSRILK